jgi:hypothetical protein
MTKALSLAALIRKGGVYYNIGGSTPPEALKEAVGAMSLPKGVDREAFLKAILEREALMPTAIGNGVAIPHPRSPIIADPALQRVALLFLKSPIPYNALDRNPPSSSSSPRRRGATSPYSPRSRTSASGGTSSASSRRGPPPRSSSPSSPGPRRNGARARDQPLKPVATR